MPPHLPDPDRYDHMKYRRCGRSGLELPVLSLGFWQNFGDDRPFEAQRAIALRAFDAGITHIDLANNYGPPYGQGERTAGRLLAGDLAPHRDELIVSTKAGWDMWPGPYGQGGGSLKHLRASLDQSLRRIGIDYVDIFYSHRYDPNTPLAETAEALATAVRQGKALYIGISSYGADDSRTMARLLRDLGTPLLIHQPSYSMLNRWIETEGLLDVAAEEGFGIIGFTALAQGMLTPRYLDGVPAGSRAADSDTFQQAWLTDERLARLRRLNEIAAGRGQTLAQLALAWALRDPRVTSLVMGASSVAQLEQNVATLDNLELTTAELTAIEETLAGDDDPTIDLWRSARLGTL